jgi:hypothetical protein
MSDYKTLENKIRDIVARPWTKDPKKVHHKLQQIQKKIIDEEPEMLNNKAIGIPDSVIEAAKQINKGKTEVDVNPQYKTDVKDSEDNDDDKKSKKNGMTKEELKGKQHKIDKNKNGKIDAHDFKLLRKEEVEQVDEISSDLAQRYRTKALAHKSKVSPDNPYSSPEHKAAIRQDRNRSQGKQLSWMKMTGQGMGGKALKVPATRKATAEEVILSDEEQSKLDAIASTFAEDAVQSAQKTAQQKVKAASITAKATVQADKIKDQARKQAQNNSYEPEGEMVEEGNLAAQIRDAKPSITGHIEVSVGDKKVKIPHRKAQDFLGSYHSKRTADEKDAHEKAFRKEIGG